MTMRTSWPRFLSALVKPETMSPRPPVCARGVHSEVMNRIRFLTGDDVPAADAVFFALGVSMAFPALAAEAEASAMRTRTLGETGRGSSLAAGGGEACFVSAGFFPALALRL